MLLSRAPYLLLLVQVLLFFRAPLFTSTHIIPFDLPSYHLPLATHIAASLGQSRFPLWDSYTYCGFPFYANVQTQLLYPLAWPVFALAQIAGLENMLDLLEWEVALHVWLGGIFCFRLLRGLGAGAPAAVLGATTWQLGGFFASQAQHLGVVCTGAWLPLIWSAAVEGSYRRYAVGAAMSYLAGYPAAAIFASSSGAILAFLAGHRRMLLIAAPWAVALAAMQLFPAVELASWSAAPERGRYFGTGGGVPLEAFISMLWPNFHRIFEPANYKLSWNPSYLYLYCGLLPLGAGLAALLTRRAPRWLYAMLAVCLFWMLGETTPLWRWAYAGLPARVQSLLLPELAAMGFILCIAIAAAIGVRALPDRIVWGAAALAAVDLTLAGSSRWLNTGLRSNSPIATPTKFEDSAEALRIARTITHRSLPPWRIDIADDSPNWALAAPVFRVPTASGNDPLCLARIKAVRRLFAKGDRWMHYYVVDKPESPILDLLNVRYLVAWAPSHAADALPLALPLPGHQLRENPDALPRFFVVGRTEATTDPVARMAASDFDVRRTAVVENAPAVDTGATGYVEVEAYSANRVKLQVTSDRPAFLVSSETYYPGWRAEIDGVPAELVLTNAAFRGLSIPTGTHRITMRFTPRILWWSLAVSAAAWLLLIKRSRPDWRAYRSPEP